MLQPWLAQAMISFRAGPTAGTYSSAIVSIGNDAGDLDSLVSSIAIADWQPLGSCQGRPIWLPVAPFARGDFRLRQDACLLFKHVGFQFDGAGAPQDLLHLDECDAKAASEWIVAGGLGLALVDHNSCVPGVSSIFGDRVVAIVDHHNDEQKHMQAAAPVAADALSAMLLLDRPAVRIIEPAVGSTCSLLAELIDDDVPAGSPLSAVGSLASRSSQLLVLMLSVIAVDTRGFTPALLGEKYVAADVRAAQKLLAALGVERLPRRLPPLDRPGSEGYELVLEAINALRGVNTQAGRCEYHSRLSGHRLLLRASP